MRSLLALGVVTAALVVSPARTARSQSPAPAASIAGGWTRDHDLSDAPAERGQQVDDGERGGRGRSGGGRRGGGGGGFGGGGFGRGGGRGRADAGGRVNPDEMARMRGQMEVLSYELEAAQKLVRSAIFLGPVRPPELPLIVPS